MADEEDPWGFDDSGDAPPAESGPGTAAAGTPAAASSAGGAGSAPGSAHGSAQGSAHGSAPGSAHGTASATPKKEGSMAPSLAEGAEETAAAPPAPEDDGYRKPVQLYRHWVRPKFLQYKYMYNYRTNYYDDVIDYLDKKQVGVTREIPRPQTWAERVLRTNNTSGRDLDAYSSSIKKDYHLIQTLAASIRTHNYHTKAYLNQKYAHVL